VAREAQQTGVEEQAQTSGAAYLHNVVASALVTEQEKPQNASVIVQVLVVQLQASVEKLLSKQMSLVVVSRPIPAPPGGVL